MDPHLKHILGGTCAIYSETTVERLVQVSLCHGLAQLHHRFLLVLSRSKPADARSVELGSRWTRDFWDMFAPRRRSKKKENEARSLRSVEKLMFYHVPFPKNPSPDPPWQGSDTHKNSRTSGPEPRPFLLVRVRILRVEFLITIPRPSMYGIFTYIGVVSGVNVGICAIHGVSGI